MSGQAIILNPSQAKSLLKELAHLEHIKKVLLKIIPESYLITGSDSWWAKSDFEALEDIKEGRTTEIKTHKELDRFLDSIQ